MLDDGLAHSRVGGCSGPGRDDDPLDASLFDGSGDLVDADRVVAHDLGTSAERPDVLVEVN